MFFFFFNILKKKKKTCKAYYPKYICQKNNGYNFTIKNPPKI